MNLIEKNIDKFNIYYDFLTQENQKYDLTNITERNECFIKHFNDSLSLGLYCNLDGLSICDVGSGAGFPGIVLKICYPSIKLTIIEPTMKRCKFLSELCNKLNIDVNIINARSEDKSIELEEKFDIVTARAVTNLSSLLEITVRLCKVNGHLVFYKGINALNELNDAKNAINLLNLKFIKDYKYDLDLDMGTHYLLDFLKTSKTNNRYPRRYSEIKKRPL